MGKALFDSAKALILEIFDASTFVGSDDEMVVAEVMDVYLSDWVVGIEFILSML